MTVLWFILGGICGGGLLLFAVTAWIHGMIFDDNTLTFDGKKYQMVPKE